MDHISLFTKDYSVPKMKGISNERQSVIFEFVEVLNRERSSSTLKGLKPLHPRFIAVKMSHMKMWELKMFLSECKKSNSFSKHWWWSVRNDRKKPDENRR